MKRAVIMGATSGMGWEVAKILAEKGWTLGIAGRREEKLKELCNTFHSSKNMASQTIEYQVIDIEKEDAPQLLKALIDKIGGMDLYFHTSGVGSHNKELEPDTELHTVSTNAMGFTRMVDAAWHYFREVQGSALQNTASGRTAFLDSGQIAVITSIAGVKGLGPAPSYSATKRYCNTYIQAIAQLTNSIVLEHGKRLKISFTDIRPGFVDTPLLDTSKHHYPMLMNPEKVARKIVRAIERKKRVAIIDWRYRVLVFFWKLIPNFIWERMKL